MDLIVQKSPQATENCFSHDSVLTWKFSSTTESTRHGMKELDLSLFQMWM